MATLSIAEQQLVIKTRIEERALIVYVLESTLMDFKDGLPKEYRKALKDEIKNHKTIIKEYKAELKKLK